MTTARQDADTVVTELAGRTCDRLLAIPGTTPDTVIAFHLLASGGWFRFFLDAGLLFLDESSGPDPEDDLLPGTTYLDIGARSSLQGLIIERMAMKSSTLLMQFSSDVVLEAREGEGGTTMNVRGKTALDGIPA